MISSLQFYRKMRRVSITARNNTVLAIFGDADVLVTVFLHSQRTPTVEIWNEDYRTYLDMGKHRVPLFMDMAFHFLATNLRQPPVEVIID